MALLGNGRFRPRHLEGETRRLLEAEPAALAFGGARARFALLLEFGMHGADDVARIYFAAADRGQHIIDRLTREPRQRRLELFLGEDLAGPFEGTDHDLPAETRILGAYRHPRGAPDLGPRLAGDDEGFPSRRRHLAIGAGDLDLVAVMQFREQRRDTAVDLGPDGAVADVGVDGIGKIERRRPARQGDEPSLRGEAEHLVVEHLELRMFEKFLGTVAFAEQFDGMAQPLIGAAFA